jgi:hypothetical protein
VCMKIIYADVIDALVAVHFIYRRSGDSQWPYVCPTCKCWNSGHTPVLVIGYINDFIGVRWRRRSMLTYSLGEKMKQAVRGN